MMGAMFKQEGFEMITVWQAIEEYIKEEMVPDTYTMKCYGDAERDGNDWWVDMVSKESGTIIRRYFRNMHVIEWLVNKLNEEK